jgi:DNA-binding CsgD family transcriptional regulator
MIQFVVQLFDVELVSYTQFDTTAGNKTDLEKDEAIDCVPLLQRNAELNFHEWSNGDANQLARRLSSIFQQVIDTHPLVPFGNFSPDAPSKRICDVLSNAGFRERAFYREYFRHFGLKYQMVIPLEITPNFHSGVTLDNSAKDFTVRDLELANLIRPHMYEAFRMVLLQEQLKAMLNHEAKQLDQLGMARVDVAFDGTIIHESPEARATLSNAFPNSESYSSKLPLRIHEWFLSQLELKVDLKPTGRPLSISCAHGRGEVAIRLLKIDHERQYASLLVRYLEPFNPVERLHRDGLTRREAEVLYRLTQGETDKEIATALGIRPTTARTHVERIRFKLRVSTRTAAAAIAQTWLRGSSQSE